jgi:Short C-terminal domain
MVLPARRIPEENAVSHNGPQEALQARAALASVPAMPGVPGSELHSGTPFLLVDYGVRHSLGWQDNRQSGPGFVVTRTSRFGRIRVAERFPLTEQGWADAWRALVACDADAAVAAAARLTQRERRSRAAAALKELDAESLCLLQPAAFNGGSGEVPLTNGQPYDLRFLRDRVTVCTPRTAQAVFEVPYRDIETVDVSGSSPAMSSGELLAVILILGLIGAVLGLLVLGLLGLFLGALVFGLLGAVIGSAWTRIETVVRIRGRDAELYFLTREKRRDALRIELSEPLRAIGKARVGDAGDPAEPAGPEAGTIPDQLAKLAALLQQGLLTRDEFEHLKARLIAQS